MPHGGPIVPISLHGACHPMPKADKKPTLESEEEAGAARRWLSSVKERGGTVKYPIAQARGFAGP